MTDPTLEVYDANGVKQTINTLQDSGQAPMANSRSVTVASDQTPIPVSMEAADPEASYPHSLVSLKRRDSVDPATTKVTGSGELSYDVQNNATVMSIGSTAKEPGRVYAEGRSFLNAGQPQFMNGGNTPWNEWNEFGSTGVGLGTYDPVWWDEELQRMVDRGVNSIRVWITCSGENQGVVANADGTIQPPTALFWSNLDDLAAKCELYGIFLMPTLISFDHFSWNIVNNEKWMQMIWNETSVQSFIDEYVVPMCNRYANNKYVWAYDVCNEIEWITERADHATPSVGTCDPVGGGSDIVNFSYRVPDFVVGQQIIIDGVSYGAVTERISDTQVRIENSFPGASGPRTNGGGAGQYLFTGMNWSTVQRYCAMVAKAIHQSDSYALVCMGAGTIKYSSPRYDGDFFADSILISFVQDSDGVLDFHQIHWYEWASPFYELLLSPTEQQLSEKPAVMGEFSCQWAGLNIPNLRGWFPQTWYNAGNIIWVDDNGTLRKYRNTQSGNSGLDTGPSGTGTNIVDGNCRWDYIAQDDTWQQNTFYNAYSMVISDSINTAGRGRIYLTENGGTSGVNRPQGTGDNIGDNDIIWRYRRDCILSYREAVDFFIANGWQGSFPWTTNTVDFNQGYYYVDLGNDYPKDWQPNFDYYVNNMVVNPVTREFYRCITQGKSDATPGNYPTGPGIVNDGTVVWQFVRVLPVGYWTPAGDNVRDFATANSSAIFPDTSGPWENTGAVVRQTLHRAHFPAGGSVRATAGYIFDTGVTNLFQAAGLGDSLNGIFLVQKDVSTYVIIVRSGGVDQEIETSDWNGLTTWTNGSVIVEYSGPSGSVNRIGVNANGADQWLHTFDFSDSSSVQAPAVDALPGYWGIWANATISETKSLLAFDAGSIGTMKGPIYKSRSYDRNYAALQVGSGGQTADLFSLRLTEAKKYSSDLKLKSIRIVNTVGVEQEFFFWKVIKNAEVNNALQWQPYGNTSVDIAVNGNTFAETGEIVAEGVQRGTADAMLIDIDQLGLDVDGNSEVYTFQIRNQAQQTGYYFVTLEWEES